MAFDKQAYDVTSESFKKASVYIELGKQEPDGPKKDAILDKLPYLIDLNAISGGDLGSGQTDMLFDNTENDQSIIKLLEDAGKCYGTLDEAFISQVKEDLDKEISRESAEKAEKARLTAEKDEESKKLPTYEEKFLAGYADLQETIRVSKLTLSQLPQEYQKKGLQFTKDDLKKQYKERVQVDKVYDKLDFKVQMYELSKGGYKIEGISDLDIELFGSTKMKEGVSIDQQIKQMIQEEVEVSKQNSKNDVRTLGKKGKDIAGSVLLKCDFEMLDTLAQSKDFGKGPTIKEKFANAIHGIAPSLFKDTLAGYEAKKEVKSWVQKTEAAKASQSQDKGIG